MRSRAAESPVVSRSKTTNSASSSKGSCRAPARETVVPAKATRLSPAITSANSEWARPPEMEGVAKSEWAASTADSGPRSSSMSTNRSRASSASCTLQIQANIRSLGKPKVPSNMREAANGHGSGVATRADRVRARAFGGGWFVLNARDAGWQAAPGRTKHVIVGAGEGNCVVLAVGARDRSTGRDWGGYPVDETAIRNGAGVEEETSDPDQAYARVDHRKPTRYHEGWLPG